MLILHGDLAVNTDGCRRLLLQGHKIHFSFPMAFPELYMGYDSVTLEFKNETNAEIVFRRIMKEFNNDVCLEVIEILLENLYDDIHLCEERAVEFKYL